MASGLCAALTGRTHGCTDQPANVKKTLANSEPSTHGTSETSTDVRPLSGSCGHQPAIADNRFMSTRPSTTLADLFTLLFAANPFSAARASLRRWSSDEFEDGLAHGGQCRSRRRPVDSFFPALLF